MSTKQPFLPLFFGDLLASTAEWEGEEVALYLLLLGYQWSLGSLPKEPKRICKLVGYSESNFNAWWPVVGQKFVECDGRLINERLESHREKAKAISDKRANAGKDGAAKRWQKEIANGSQLPSGNMANATDLQSHPNHTKPNHKEDTESAAGSLKDSDSSDSSHHAANMTGLASQGGRAKNPPAISVATQLAIDLRAMGVNITSMHPTLHKWLADGFTSQQVIEAVGTARISKPKPEAIPANYLTPILQDIKNPTRTRRSEAREHWQKVMTAVRSGEYRKAGFTLGADIDKAVRAIGGYAALGSGNVSAEPFNEKKFRDAYAEVAA